MISTEAVSYFNALMSHSFVLTNIITCTQQLEKIK